MPEDLQELMDRGVVIFHGEAEALWGQALSEILTGSPQPIYHGGRPPFRNAPLPEYPQDYFEGNFVTPIRTFDTSRGCPFACSFCTIINVQGRNPLNYGWHLKMIPYAITEVVYVVRFTWMRGWCD